MKVLLIDDTVEITQLCERALTLQGHSVKTLNFLPIVLDKREFKVDFGELSKLANANDVIIWDGTMVAHPEAHYPGQEWGDFAYKVRNGEITLPPYYSDGAFKTQDGIIQEIRGRFTGPMIGWSTDPVGRKKQLEAGCEHEIGRKADLKTIIELLSRLESEKLPMAA